MTLSAAIMIVGNEILSGRTQDVNVKFIAERLALRGIPLHEVRVVRDDEAAIVKTAQELSRENTYVFSTGGIGPTHDDITADCMAKAFGVSIDVNAEARQRLEIYYAPKGIVLNEGRLRMARIPDGAALIDNPVSAAPGFKIKNVFVMAGVPNIMQAMFLGIEETLARGVVLLSHTVTGSLREGDIAVPLGDLQRAYPDVEIGSYPTSANGRPVLSLVLRGADEKRLTEATEKLAALVRPFDADIVVSR